jgi:hypothetical protein
MVLGRPLVPPKSIADEEATLSMFLLRPSEVRLADGEPDGDPGEPVSRLRRFEGCKAAGWAGESQKKEPKPGEPLKEFEPENDGEGGTVDLRRADAGESTSMASLRDDLVLGESTGSV